MSTFNMSAIIHLFGVCACVHISGMSHFYFLLHSDFSWNLRTFHELHLIHDLKHVTHKSLPT